MAKNNQHGGIREQLDFAADYMRQLRSLFKSIKKIAQAENPVDMAKLEEIAHLANLGDFSAGEYADLAEFAANDEGGAA